MHIFPPSSARNGRNTGLTVIGLAVLAYAVILSGASFLHRIGYELLGPYTADSPIYWAVGRGILNGLMPYRDLFETKPPGIFLISSASLWLTGTMQLGAWVQAILLALVPLSIAAAVWTLTKEQARTTRLLIAGGALLFGITLTLYIGERSGEFQVESFGAAFAVAYAGLLAARKGILSRRDIALASFLILLSVGMKEPFLLVCFSIALLFCETPRALLRGFVLPLLIAAVIGLVALRVLGMWDGYFGVYIPEMFGRYGNPDDPLWMRSFLFDRLYVDLEGFSPMLALGIVGITLAQVIVSFRTRGAVRGALNMVLVFCVLSFAALAVGSGNTYYNHHFVFAVAGYAAVFLALTRDAVGHWERCGFTRAIALAAFVLLVPTVQRDPLVDYKAQAASYSLERKAVQQVADHIDGVLDRCGMQRYLFIGGNGGQPYGYTRHSPLGPLFFQFDHLLDDHHEKFRQEFTQSLHQARLIVFHNFDLNAITEETQAYLREEFTERPWACAGTMPSLQPYTLFYRKPWRVWGLRPE